MSKVQCGKCLRLFRSSQYLHLHLNQKSNRVCYLHSVRNVTNVVRVPSDPPNNNLNVAEAPQNLEGAPQIPQIVAEAPQNVAFQVQNNDTDSPNHSVNDFPMPDTDFSESEGPNEDLMEGESGDEGADSDSSELIRLLFAEYTSQSKNHRSWIDPEVEAGIELMNILTVSRAPLSMFNKLFDWHIAHLGCKTTITRSSLLNKLRKRYNMEGTAPYEVTTTLPHSNVNVKIPCHDFMQMTMDVLTDPRIEAEDYLWCSGDPFGEPTDEWVTIADITDGRCYRETYNKLIRPAPTTESGRRKVLLPLMLYLDGCVTGFNENLSLELVKFSLGIFTSKAREKECTWRVLGAVPQFQAVKSDAARAIQSSGHVEADGYVTETDSEQEGTDVRRFLHEFEFGDYINSSDEEDEMCDINLPDHKDQDLHVILHVIMYRMREMIRKGGFEWDLNHNGELRHIHFVPFMMLIKGDTVEHGKHCGQYGARNRGIKCLCRYCVCPADTADDPFADYEMKSPKLIRKLVAKRDMAGLKNISQQYIFNMWYEFDFGCHNELGVHSACPMEMLHWIQLGMYKYSRANFFAQTGTYSILTKAINRLASGMAWLFQRQSDRAYPRTKFTKGLQKGTLMAHEMTGLMLVLLSVLRSSRGRELILDTSLGNQVQFFPNEVAIANWIMVLELQLTFEAWLKQPKMKVNSVIRLRRKVRELLLLTKQVARREAGMGFKLNNFHATIHVPDDILNFGPPHVVDTKSNESGHKPDKGSARRTQKRPKSFDIQSVRQVNDRRVILMGMEELAGRPRWDYFVAFDRFEQLCSDRIKEMRRKSSCGVNSTGVGDENGDVEAKLTGVSAKFGYLGDEYGMMAVHTAMKMKHKYQYPPSIVHILEEVTIDLIASGYSDPILFVHSELDIGSQKYRASPHFQGKPWYDWALYRYPRVNEGFAERILPVHLRCFVDLRFLPAQNATRYEPKVYFVAETAKLNSSPGELIKSDLLVPYVKEEGAYLDCKADFLEVDRIFGPACVIPDLGNTNPRAFQAVRSASQWANLFEEWINEPFLVQNGQEEE